LIEFRGAGLEFQSAQQLTTDNLKLGQGRRNRGAHHSHLGETMPGFVQIVFARFIVDLVFVRDEAKYGAPSALRLVTYLAQRSGPRSIYLEPCILLPQRFQFSRSCCKLGAQRATAQLGA